MSQKTHPRENTGKNNFPDLPAYSAIWCPIHIEPIPGSGEKLTIAIAVKGNDGAVRVSKTTSPKVINCLAGSEALGKRLLSMINICIRSAEEHLKHRISLDEWHAPIQNVLQGKTTEALGNDIEDIFWQAAGLTSMLSASDLIAQNSNKEKNNTTRFWKRDIKTSLKTINIKLTKYLDKSVPLPGGKIKTTLDFFNGSHAIDFGVINTDSKKDTYKKQFHLLQSRLWELDQVRESNTGNQILKIDYIGLLVKSANENDLYEEIKLEAEQRDIFVKRARDASEAAYTIQKLVA